MWGGALVGAEEADLVELRLLAHQQRRRPPDLMPHRDAQQQRPDHTQGGLSGIRTHVQLGKRLYLHSCVDKCTRTVHQIDSKVPQWQL